MNKLFTSPSKRLVLLALCVSPLAFAQAQAPAQVTRVATMNTARLLSESALARAADAKLLAEFSSREKAIQAQIAVYRDLSKKFDAEAPRMSERERTTRTRDLLDMDKEMQLTQRQFRDDLAVRQNEERALIAQRSLKVVEQIAKDEQIDIVLHDPVWSHPRIDITDKVLKQLER